MTDLEIDKALALAIGWKKMGVLGGMLLVYTGHPHDKVRVNGRNWVYNHRIFSHKDPAVIWRIAERYCCFPSHISNGDYKAARAAGHCIASGYECLKYNYQKSCWENFKADSPATAVALSVIGKAKK